MKAIFLIFLTLYNAFATTYHIDPSGNDANPGTSGSPWRTYANVPATVAGDIVIVHNGVYTNGTYLNPANNGTQLNPIIIIAENPLMVTNSFGVFLQKAGYQFRDMVWDGYPGGHFSTWANGYAIEIKKGADYTTISNCIFNANGSSAGFTTSGADIKPGEQHDIMINQCKFLGQTGITMMATAGYNITITNSLFADGKSSDAIRPFGSNIVIVANTFTNMDSVVGVGNHPDILQTFGENPSWGNGSWSRAVVFKRNLVINNPTQLIQAEQNGVTNNFDWLLMNNLFIGGVMQASIDIAGVKFYNNTWYQCNAGVCALLQFAYFDTSGDPATQSRGSAMGGKVKNNAFIECNTSTLCEYSEIPVTWNGSSWVTWVSPTPDPDLEVDYNFFNRTGNLAKTSGYAEVHGINGGNPLLTDPTNLDFRPQAGSPLINAGVSIAEVTEDYYGNSRSGTPTIGAIEFQAEGSNPSNANAVIRGKVLIQGKVLIK